MRDEHPDVDGRARRLATNIVSLAILGAGAGLVVAAILVFFAAETGLGIFGGVVLLGLGLLALLGAWFFQLVPLKADELQDEAEAYEAAHGKYEFKD